MHRLKTIVALALWLLQAGAPLARAQAPRADGGEEFGFYGLRFGMSSAEVRRVARTNDDGTEALDPGHGIRHLQLAYDYRGRLGEIRASYDRPGEPLREAALRLALRERFMQPVQARWRGVAASLDEGSNRAAIVLVLLSQTMRQEAIEHFRDEYLAVME